MLPPTLHNITLFKLDFNVKFPLLRLLRFLSDLKSTIMFALLIGNIAHWSNNS